MNKIEEEIDSLIERHKASRDFCHNSYHCADERHRCQEWLDTKKYWVKKIDLLEEMKELLKEYKEVSPR